MKRAIIIGSNSSTLWLENCLKTFQGYKEFPVLVVVNDDFEVGKILHTLKYTDLDEFFLLHDTVEIKDPSFFKLAFETEGSVSLCLEPTTFGMFLGKYRRKILETMDIKPTLTKKDAVIAEMSFNQDYCSREPKMTVLFPEFRNSNVFVDKFGRKNMLLENEYLRKYKGTWCWEQVK